MVCCIFNRLKMILYYYNSIIMLGHIFYINLGRRFDRNEHMISLLNNHNLLPGTTRIEAVDGKKLTNNDLIKLANDNIFTMEFINQVLDQNTKKDPTLSVGAIGCALSHISAWERIVKEQIPEALIFEDDIEIKDNFVTEISKLKSYFPENYDMIHLGYGLKSLLGIRQIINKYFVKTNSCMSGFGYILSNKGAKKLLEHIFPISAPYDVEITKKISNFDIYLISPLNRIVFSLTSVINEKFGSDIQDDGNSWLYMAYRYKYILLIIFIVIIILIIMYFKR